MDKYIELFCKKNPKTEIKCPECNSSTVIKSNLFYRNDKYLFKCKCGIETEFNTKKLKKALIDKMKYSHINIK